MKLFAIFKGDNTPALCLQLVALPPSGQKMLSLQVWDERFDWNLVFSLQIRWARSNDRNLPRSGGRKEPDISVRNDISIILVLTLFEQIGFSQFLGSLVMHEFVITNLMDARLRVFVLILLFPHSLRRDWRLLTVSCRFSLHGFQNSKLSCKVRDSSKTLSSSHAIWESITLVIGISFPSIRSRLAWTAVPFLLPSVNRLCRLFGFSVVIVGKLLNPVNPQQQFHFSA